MIVLVGFMGAGKTSVGRLVAQRLGMEFIDTDELISRRAGAPIPRVFEVGGEAAFRALESDVVAEVLGGPDAVVALGGGALGDPVTVQALRRARVVELDVTIEEVLQRVGADPSRPMLASADPADLFARRRPLYRQAATFTIDTTGRTVEQVAEDVRRRLSGAGERRVRVDAASGGYDVVVGRDLTQRLAALLPELPDAEKAFVVTHPVLSAAAETARAALVAAGLSTEIIEVPEGESSKSLAEAGRLCEALARAPAHRHDLVVGLGGGVVTDLAGFAASVYARGVPVVHVATSLLGQVDAAIGGKTGVNLPEAKNLVGTFYQPRLVVCDVSLLHSLPEAEMRAGLAEVVKYGFIADPGILDLVSRHAGDVVAGDEILLDEIVYRCAAIKARVVSADERESGRRAILNYGHTFGHAIEQAGAYESIRHGEAVALGMMAAAYLAHELDRIDSEVVSIHRRVLTAAGLPVHANLDYSALETAWLRDKKYRRGVRFVLLRALGDPETGVEAPQAAVAAALKRMAG